MSGIVSALATQAELRAEQSRRPTLSLQIAFLGQLHVQAEQERRCGSADVEPELELHQQALKRTFVLYLQMCTILIKKLPVWFASSLERARKSPRYSKM